MLMLVMLFCTFPYVQQYVNNGRCEVVLSEEEKFILWK